MGGLSIHNGGGGTVGSEDSTFCIVNLAALDLDTALDECSSERSDWPSINMARGKLLSGYRPFVNKTLRWAASRVEVMLIGS